MSVTKNDQRLCVVSANERRWRYASYGNRGNPDYDFKIRTYLPGRVDERFEPLNTITSFRSLARHLSGKNKETPVIAKVVHFQKLANFKDKAFAPVMELMNEETAQKKQKMRK